MVFRGASGFMGRRRFRTHSKLRDQLTQKDRGWTHGSSVGGGINVPLRSGASVETSSGVGGAGPES